MQAMVEHARAAYPLEACGLVAGLEGRSVAVYAIDNILRSRVAFEMDPLQQVKALLEIDSQELDLLAIYHSHPQGPTGPSPTDVARAYYPESANLIISLHDEARPVVRAYHIIDGVVNEVGVIVGD